MNIKKILSPFLNPFTGPIIVISFLILILVFFILPKYSHENSKSITEKRAVEIIENLKKVRSYYTQSVISKVKKDEDININFDHATKADTIPLPATLLHDLSSLISKDGMEIKMYSNFPFENRKNRVLNKFEEESLRYLIQNPNKIYTQEIVKNDEKRFNVAVADVFFDKSCVSCHNTRIDSPKRDWEVGDVRGAILISTPLREELVLTSYQVVLVLIFLVAIILILGVHYSIMAIRRQKEHKEAKQKLEKLVNERTSTLQNTVKLLNEYKNAVDISAIVSKTDRNGRITYVNDEFIKISKFSEDELIGKNHNIVRHEDMPKEVFKDLWKTIKSKKVWKGQITNRAKDGTAYYVASTIVPILDINDEIEEFLAIRLDVTDIVKSQIKAQRADEAKSSFLANMSHEIRTPLNAIIGFSELLSKAQINVQSKKQAAIVHSSAKSLLTIINDILDVSKIESGNFEIAKESTDLYFVSESVVELFSKRANEKQIKLIFDIDNKIPLCVLTDGIRVRQVLSNLLSNAIKFTPNKGVVTFNIKLIGNVNGKSKIRFEIEDSGIGIPEDKVSSIFNPFIQVDHKSNREYQGTGLGLSICRHIVESLGSRIELESSVGNGTRFWFDLDLESCEDVLHQRKDYISSLNFKVTDINSQTFHYAKRYLNIFGTINDSSRDIDIVVLTCKENIDDKLKLIKDEFKDKPILILHEFEDEINSLVLNPNEQALALPFYASKLNDSIEELLNKTNLREINSSSDSLVQYCGKILIAEDNSANQELISYILDDMKLEYTIKENGKEALEEYILGSYDIVLMDINMPVMDGVEAFNKIRAYENENSLKQTPIVALTANAIKGDREKFLSLGMSDYLSKPINVNELKKVFDIYLNQEKTSSVAVGIEENLILKEQISKIDIEKVSSKLGISSNIAELIVNKFKSEIKKDLEELKKHIENEDNENITQKAHYIKNSCLNMLLDDVCELLQVIEKENFIKENNISNYEKLEEKINQIIK